MKPSLFGYARPESVEDALSLLAQGDGETRVLAGGQSLVPLLNLRIARVNALIDVNGLSELSFITREDGMLRVGALPVIAISKFLKRHAWRSRYFRERPLRSDILLFAIGEPSVEVSFMRTQLRNGLWSR